MSNTVLSKASTSTNPLGRQLVAVKSDHDAGADDRADHHLLTGVMARWSVENKKLISGKQCKIETGAHHKNCTLAGLTLSHFHITTNDQYVPFLLDQLQVILKHYKFIAYNNPKQSLFGPKVIVRQEFKGTIPMWKMVPRSIFWNSS